MEDYDDVGTRTYSIFGSLDGYGFCCYVDDPAPRAITLITLLGTGFRDELYFTYAGQNIEHIDSVATAGGGSDDLTASDSPFAAFGKASVLNGGPGNDFLVGLDGNDQLNGFDIWGAGSGADDDDIEGGEGGDQITAGAGADECNGGPGDDLIFGNDGLDVLRGGDNNDTIYGNQADDDLIGGFGDDWMDGGAGNDDISGEGGTDTLYGGNGDDEVCSGTGTGDRLHGGPSSGGSSGANDDQLWADSSTVSPGGSVVGSNANCGDSNAGFSTWAGAGCTYNLTTRPAGCP